MTRQQEFSRKDADVVPAPIMRHSSFIAGIASDASIDMDLSADGITYIYSVCLKCSMSIGYFFSVLVKNCMFIQYYLVLLEI